MGVPTDSELAYYRNRKFKSLEFEEQARVRQLCRMGFLAIVDGVISFTPKSTGA